MNKFFIIVFALVILQRLIELVIARSNATYLRSLGGYEVDARHYKYIVILHLAFLSGLFIEVSFLRPPQPSWWGLSFSLFIIAQGMRVWCLASLGRFWNTRIFVLPGAKPVKKGPYLFLRHPNYLVVIAEILLLPISFGAYYTAVFASIFNALVLNRRIKAEESALAEVTMYNKEMDKVPRLMPKL
jgi:methyltransferase